MTKITITEMSMQILINTLSQINVILLDVHAQTLSKGARDAIEGLMKQQQDLIASFAKENQK